MLRGDRSLSELGPHALSSAGAEGLRPRLPTDGLHVTQGAAHVPHQGAGISQACGQLVCHCGAPPRQTTHKRITRCDALYGVGERRRGQSRPPHPHPSQSLAEGLLSPLRPFSNALGWLSGAARGWVCRAAFL